MNADILKGKWQQWKGKAQQNWGKLTRNEALWAAGTFTEYAGILQERYGRERLRAEQEADDPIAHQGW